MKQQGVKMPPAVTAFRTQATERWRALGARERLGAGLAGSAVAIWLVWSIAVAPALRTVREAPARIDAADAQLQAMQRMAMEARELQGTSRVPTSQAIEALKTATDRLGDKARLNVQGDRVTLTVTGATGGDLRSWLGEARRGARTRPVEAQLTRGPSGYTGTIILTVGGAA